MKENIRISVIVPVYNLQDDLERCVVSIMAQTYSDLEIILIDDGSTDRSRDVIQKLADMDGRIVPVYKENGGVTSARLAGLRKATGEYIGFVDGDDEIEPDMYEFLLKNALDYNADISHCGYQMVFDDGRVNYFYNTGQVVLQDRNTGLKDLLEGVFVEPGLWNKLFHRKLLDKLLNSDVMDLSIKINEDLLMNFYLFSDASKSIYEDKCKYHYLVRGGSATRRNLSSNKIFDPVKVKKIIMQKAEGDILTVAQKAYIGTCISIYNSLVLNGLRNYKAEAKKIQEELLAHRALGRSVGKKQRILIWMILHLSFGYEKIYRLYEKYLLNNRYE